MSQEAPIREDQIVTGPLFSELLGHGCVYGGGLHKLEPNELASVPADEIAWLAGPALAPPQEQGDLFVEEVA